MPELKWIGKEKVISHHQDVPYRVMDHQYSFNTEKESGNRIIHGDNLEALKALLPEYEGKIKCIYIDPPYNTGNESWVYNDNVNHPKIKKWLGQVVGKESEDLTRHDKWLCMMYPRLKLLQKLLSDDGAIFISIDDNEQANLKLICDEVFGETNFLATMPRITKKAGKTSDLIASNNDHLLCYKRNKLIEFNSEEHVDKGYKHVDEFVEQRGKYKLSQTLDYGSIQYSVSLDYEIKIEGVVLRPGNVSKEEMESRRAKNPKSDYCWRWSKDLYEFGKDQGFIVLRKSKNGFRIYTKTYEKATIAKNRSDNKYKIEYQQRGRAITTLDFIENVYSNDNSRKEVDKIFNSKVFEYSKPSTLIEKIIFAASSPNSIILDSFAGSGTTAHAVLNLNKKDDGNRKFILIEMEDYAESITAERVKRVINGYAGKEGTGGSFDYFELGEPLFVGDNTEYLNENVGIEKLRQYIWYTETRTGYYHHTVAKEEKKNPYHLGIKDGTAYYFIYEKNELTTLDYEMLSTIKAKAQQYILYADNCLLPKEFMMQHNIVFKKIPRDITRF